MLRFNINNGILIAKNKLLLIYDKKIYKFSKLPLIMLHFLLESNIRR